MPNQHAPHGRNDGRHDVLDIQRRGLGGRMKPEMPIGCTCVHPVEHEGMHVDVQIDGSTEPLNDRQTARRPPQLGQNPRPLQEKATNRSALHTPHPLTASASAVRAADSAYGRWLKPREMRVPPNL